jgi:tetratricopeptide (TPR) repeat protein
MSTNGRWKILVLGLFLQAAPLPAQVAVTVRQVPGASTAEAVVEILSEARGAVAISLTGLGSIKSTRLVTGASETYRYTKSGILQYRAGKGKTEVRDVLPVDVGKVTRMTIVGLGAEPTPTPAAPVPAETAIDYRPQPDNQIQIRHPFGPAFEKLSTAEKIRMVETSPDTGKMPAGDRDKLLGFLLNQRGVEEVGKGSYSEAIASLRRADGYLPELGAIDQNLAFATAMQSNQKRKLGFLDAAETGYGEALKILERAPQPHLESQIHSALASVYVEQAKNLSVTNQTRKKTLYLKALEEDPSHAVALYELGQMAYAEYDLEGALAFFESAQRSAPQQSLIDLIEKVRTEIAEAGDFVTEDRGNFKISFEGREVQEIAREVRKHLADAEREIGRKIGIRPETTIPVVIYNGGQFNQILGLHSWAGGAYDGKIRLPLGDLSEQDLREGEARIRQLVFHEYAHAVLHNRAPGVKIPIWFHEGLAQILAGQNPYNPGTYQQMVNAVQSGMIPPPSEMHEGFSSVSDPGVARLLYLASFSFVHRLIEEEGGWARVRKVVDQLSRGNGMDSSIQNAYRKSLVELEDVWIQDLGRRG